MRWLAADEVAALLDRSPHAVYCLASRHQWKRRVRNGRTYYDPAHVAQALPAVGDVLRDTLKSG
jgi:hypothetical protein